LAAAGRGTTWGIGRLFRPLFRVAARRPLDCIAVWLAAALTVQIAVNALLLQDARHPAPLFFKPQAQRAAARAAPTDRVRSPEERTGSLQGITNQPPPERVKAVQAALADAGRYDGPVDGAFGPKTNAAILAYELSEGMPPTGDPSQAVLDRLRKSEAAATAVANVPLPRAKAAEVRTAETKTTEPAAPAPSPRILALQKALAKLGYGPVRLDGVAGAATKQAISKFEADRRLPVTGEISPKVLKELASVSGMAVQ
jgi:peptidoglycan hydrolase-like protein with peptidoglycan-binding domain